MKKNSGFMDLSIFMCIIQRAIQVFKNFTPSISTIIHAILEFLIYLFYKNFSYKLRTLINNRAYEVKLLKTIATI